ncbi:hypothetical protein WJX73_006657 [Symbiochloris irregularis]|uniref:Cation transporter n=1 Tax=Symbiochloris irregularis TaxID=706552 RepID=A0AAW1P870_9CHLO
MPPDNTLPLLNTPFASDGAQSGHIRLPSVLAASPCNIGNKGDGSANREQKIRNKLIAALVLSFVFMIVEVTGGFIANSLAIMTDAAHLLSDVSGFAVAIFAAYYAAKASSKNTHTFGYHRIEVLGALASVLSTWLVTGILVYEAVDRILHPVQVDGKLMSLLALVGVVGLLSSKAGGGHGHDHGHGDGGEEDSINLRGAVLHVIGDLVQSIGVALAGALIWWKQDDPRWCIADPICTFVFAGLVLLTTFKILRDISDILMERVPRGHVIETTVEGLMQVDGVADVHDLHVWALTPGIPLLAAHLAITPSANPAKVLEDATAFCQSRGIDHSTLQLVGHDCPPVVAPSPRHASSSRSPRVSQG